MSVNNDSLLIKYKKVGLSNSTIAKKMGVTEQEVQQRWEHIVDLAAQFQSSGYDKLSDHFTNMCGQYQLLGESMKVMALALANTASPEDVYCQISTDPKETHSNLMRSFIILRPFVPVNPADSFQTAIKGN